MRSVKTFASPPQAGLELRMRSGSKAADGLYFRDNNFQRKWFVLYLFRRSPESLEL